MTKRIVYIDMKAKAHKEPISKNALYCTVEDDTDDQEWPIVREFDGGVFHVSECGEWDVAIGTALEALINLTYYVNREGKKS